jgi:DNA-binding response OmpR family regulator
MVLPSFFSASRSSGIILLVGASLTLVGHLSEMLRRVGFAVAFASEPSEWQHILTSCDVAILVDSRPFWFSRRIFDICAAIRHDSSDIPVIVVGPNDLESKVRLFKIGADDYLLDAVDHKEFLARIRALMRRRAQKG